MAAHAARPTAVSSSVRTPSVDELAWLAAAATAVVTLVAILAAGPSLGRVLPHDAIEFWPSWRDTLHPEPTEQGRYLIALAAPLLLIALTFGGARRPLRLRPRTIAWTVTGVQIAGAAFVVACVIAQREFAFGPIYSPDDITFHSRYFSVATLLVAAVGTGALVAILRRPSVGDRFAALARETTALRIGCALLAVAATALWLTHAVYTEDTIGGSHNGVVFHIAYTLDEAFAVLDGRTPLVDFAAQYASLWPFALAAGMSLLGTTVGVFVGIALVGTAAAMLAIYAVLRRVAGGSLAGLLLFLPVLATSLFTIDRPLDNRFSHANYFGTFPLRYAGPFVLAWLLARHLDGVRPRRIWPLFLVSGLIVLNNAEAGIPALVATVAALLWTGGRPTRATLGRLAGSALVGLVASYALVSVLTLARTASLPDLGLLFRYSRMFGAGSFALVPMPPLGFHLVIYLTFVAAIGVATVQTIVGGRRVLAGMLAWTGLFGLGASAYYAGRSHPDSLVAMFPMWALALGLLVIVVVERLVRQPRRRPSIAQVACLFGFAVAICSLAQVPTPWSQLDRLRATGRPVLAAPAGQEFVARNTDPGESALILIPLGHRIAFNLGIDNVGPYTGSSNMPTPGQYDEAIAALREAGGRKIFFFRGDTNDDVQLGLATRGFRLAEQQPESGMSMWIDTAAR